MHVTSDIKHQQNSQMALLLSIEVRKTSRETEYNIYTLAEFAAQGHASCMDFTSQVVLIIYSM